MTHSLLVLEPGLLTTVQDLGRPGLMRFGVTPGGALDRTALVLGNLLVGNEPGAAGLEITLIGPRLRFSKPAVVVLTGADLGATLNDVTLPLWAPAAVRSDDELAFLPTPTGAARAYVCIAGGVSVDLVMGSRSTDLFGRFGGWSGRALEAGDELPLVAPRAPIDHLLRRRLAHPPPKYDQNIPVRVVLGPQADLFTSDGLATFLDGAYAVSPQSDRMGLRLTGPGIAHRDGADLISEGIAHGAIQVPGDGQPIVLLSGRQTIGGYPKIATVIGADLDALGQRRPGHSVRFAAVDLQAARALTLTYHAALGDDAVMTEPRPVLGWTDDQPPREEDDDAKMSAWNPVEVTKLVAALRNAGVSSFRLEVASAGLKLEVHWGASGPGLEADQSEVAAGSAKAAGATPPEDLVTAPLLGVFYRRPGPDQPPFVAEGESVEAGQPIGLLEVMKTYHEVNAPRAGLLIAFLVDDGQYVEYGAPIARLATPPAASNTS